MPDPTSLVASPRHTVEAPPNLEPAPEVRQRLRIVPWSDPVIETLGHDPRSWYVEQFWLPIIGPTSTWLLRRIVAHFDREPDGFELNLDDTARALGLGGREGRHSPFQKALRRCVSFKLARHQGPSALAVYRLLPPLSGRHLDRLPPSLLMLHAEWSASQNRSGGADEAHNRARRLAVKLLDIGADRHAVEIQLIRWRVHPALAQDATDWAMALATTA